MYASKQDILDIHNENFIIMLTDRENNEVVIDERLSAAIEMASAKIDGYIGKVAKLPLMSVPSLLTSYCIDLTIYELATGGDAWTEDIQRRRDEAVKFLTLVANGKASLGLPKLEAEQAASKTTLYTEAPERRFKRGIL